MATDDFKAVGKETRVPDASLVSCGDVSCEFLVNPIPRPAPAPITLTYRPQKREVVLIDADKPNSMAVMRIVQQMLRDLGIPVRDEIQIKINASVPMPDEQMERAASEQGLVVCGIND